MKVRVRMSPRDPAESHRASTPLELFFDLTFVVAVAEAGSAFERGLVGGRAGAVLIGYPMVFFAIWWGWMNFSWFASAYDTDDVWYRVAVLVQMAGVLVVAAGIPRAMDHRDFALILSGYVVMRMAMVALWLRAADPAPWGARAPSGTRQA
jgi:low temperature requirement protein LtrA